MSKKHLTRKNNMNSIDTILVLVTVACIVVFALNNDRLEVEQASKAGLQQCLVKQEIGSVVLWQKECK